MRSPTCRSGAGSTSCGIRGAPASPSTTGPAPTVSPVAPITPPTSGTNGTATSSLGTCNAITSADSVANNVSPRCRAT
jgi:hypothetical protein